jgi:tRNA/tmRNA/rRNA uracil-C5-methylase (TrmA/RlmC/RlmD family)
MKHKDYFNGANQGLASFGQFGLRVLNAENSIEGETFVAIQVLTDAVMQYAELQNGDQVLDLYGGVGLFSAAALSAVGQSGRVDLVEASSSAIGDAKINFENVPNVNIYLGDVAKIMPRIGSADVVILDPPRDGAGQLVLQQMVKEPIIQEIKKNLLITIN